MRIWDIPPKHLCRVHLLGEHRELHAIWSILIHHKQGYAHHPETLRWRGKLKALYDIHEDIVVEMTTRGYQHHSPLDPKYATGSSVQDVYIDSIDSQKQMLQKKKCRCLI